MEKHSNPGNVNELKWERELKASLYSMAGQLQKTIKPWRVPNRVFRVEDYGAIANSDKLCTEAIQAAIDDCSNSGGGYVRFSFGDYLTGTLVLKSNVMLEIESRSRILGSPNLVDYPEHIAKKPTVMESWMNMKYSLIFAEEVENIGFCGGGIIDGQGGSANFTGRESIGPITERPFLIRVLECKNVAVYDITLQNSGSWMQDYINCDNVYVSNIKVKNWGNWNNDGIDLDGCRNVVVRDSSFSCIDDALCLKGAGLRDGENILIENCTVITQCNGLKFGTDTQAGVRDVLVRNVTLGGPADIVTPSWTWRIDTKDRDSALYASTGISWMSVDGGKVENLLVEDSEIHHVYCPVFLRINDRGRTRPELPKPGVGELRKLIFKNIKGTDCFNRPSIIQGHPDEPVTDVVFRDFEISTFGDVSKEQIDDKYPAYMKDAYPDAQGYPLYLPASGFWMDNFKDIHFINVDVKPTREDVRDFKYIVEHK